MSNVENRSSHADDKSGSVNVVTVISFIRSTFTSIVGAFVFFQACYLTGMLRAHFSDVLPSILNRNAVEITNLPYFITSLSENSGPEFYLVGVGAIILAPCIFVGFISFMFYSVATFKVSEVEENGSVRRRLVKKT